MEFLYTGATQLVLVRESQANQLQKELAFAIKHGMVRLLVVSDQEYAGAQAVMRANGAQTLQWKPATAPAAPATPAPVEAPPANAEPKQPTQYATASQKEEIIRLLNHPVITRQEKTKMLLNINRLDEKRATEAIAKLRKAIEDRSES